MTEHSPSFRRAGAKPPGWPASVEPAVAAALPDFLLRQRWYPAKDGGRPDVRLNRMVPLVAPEPMAAAVWEARPPAGAPLLLFIPLAIAEAEAADPTQVIASLPGGAEHRLAVVEATSLDAFVHAWIGVLAGGNDAVPGVQGVCTGRFADLGLSAGRSWPVRRGKAEQSNTSIRVGEHAILKIIRKLEEGVHPELEVARFLTECADFTATPKLLGWIELEGPPGTGCRTLSILQQFVANQGDGWGWLLDRLHRLGDAGARGEAAEWLRRLGLRTAEMHRAFSRASADPAFQPEPVTKADISRWREGAIEAADRMLDRLSERQAPLPESARTTAERLISQRRSLGDRIAAFAPAPGGFMKTRHHGDFHLGQVLVADGDAIIIDFEGEPMRPLAERRAKHACLRDVAGMLRSLSYAAATAARNLPPEDMTGRNDLAAWEAEAATVFSEAYFAAATGIDGLPSNRADAERIVHFFMLEKALYEVAYELANRPDWVEIPLRGALSLIEGAPA